MRGMGQFRDDERRAASGGGRLAQGAGSRAVPSTVLALAAALLLPAFAARPFDSAAWLERRADLTHEVERLRDAYASCVKLLKSPAEDVALPVETFPDGSVKTTVTAKKAQYFLSTELVWAEGVVVRTFREGGAPDLELEAASGVVDRQTKSGWAEGDVRITQGGSVFRGRGVYFSSPEEYVRVTRDSDFTSTDVKGQEAAFLPAGFAPAAAAKAAASDAEASGAKAAAVRIRSVTSDFDRKAGVILFEGGVRVDYGADCTLCADRAFAFLAASNRLTRVVADGSVVISNGLRVGTCALATYRKAKGEIEMFGSRGGAKARLSERGDRASDVEGDRIRFWLDAEQVEVSNARISTEHEGKKEDIL